MMNITPTDTYRFPSIYMVLINQGGHSDLPYIKLFQTEDIIKSFIIQ